MDAAGEVGGRVGAGGTVAGGMPPPGRKVDEELPEDVPEVTVVVPEYEAPAPDDGSAMLRAMVRSRV
jgi:hypothetical protein